MIKSYRLCSFKLLTLSTNSVIKKIIVVRTVYFYNSVSIVGTKKFVTESVLSQKLYEETLASLDREKSVPENGV